MNWPAPDPTSPFYITGPATIAFSGGRTSGNMLFRILYAHGGTLPDDVIVTFQNTGREVQATLDFVHECGRRWSVDIVWLEYRRDADTGHVWAERVTYETASRNGEPFEMMLVGKQMLPNPVARFCTVELKIRTVKRYVMQVLGWQHWTAVVGLRADEARRVLRGAKNESKERWRRRHPLYDAGITKEHVLEFWAEQDFDLQLPGEWAGNCDGCFLKNRAALAQMFRTYPDLMQWWVDAEHKYASTVPTNRGFNVFRADREDYDTMARVVRDRGILPFDKYEKQLPCEDAACGV